MASAATHDRQGSSRARTHLAADKVERRLQVRLALEILRIVILDLRRRQQYAVAVDPIEAAPELLLAAIGLVTEGGVAYTNLGAV